MPERWTAWNRHKKARATNLTIHHLRIGGVENVFQGAERMPVPLRKDCSSWGIRHECQPPEAASLVAPPAVFRSADRAPHSTPSATECPDRSTPSSQPLLHHWSIRCEHPSAPHAKRRRKAGCEESWLEGDEEGLALACKASCLAAAVQAAGGDDPCQCNRNAVFQVGYGGVSLLFFT